MEIQEFHQNKIAIVYDFDKTLSPKDMQEYGVFGQIGVSGAEFWKEVHKERDETGGEELLVYMRKMIKAAGEKGDDFSLKKFHQHGRTIEFFNGVNTWFDRINSHVSQVCPQSSISVEHYIVSSGLGDMINACEISKYFEKIYACEFIYENGVPVWPGRLVTDAAKTQYLFRINKGILDPNDKDVNAHMEEAKRRVPFSNLIYIGDSDTDIPSMNVTMKNGGHSIAVFHPEKLKDREHMEKMKSLRAAKRVDFFCEADYGVGSALEGLMFNTLDVIAKRIALRQKIFELPPKGHISV